MTNTQASSSSAGGKQCFPPASNTVYPALFCQRSFHQSSLVPVSDGVWAEPDEEPEVDPDVDPEVEPDVEPEELPSSVSPSVGGIGGW